ncbi:HTH-type transcriptional repressor NanR [Streptomyces fumanus]
MSEIQRPGALYQQVAAAIREAIQSGEFAPDSLLPSEAQLMARYGVSRPTVRNAIAALRTEGLVNVRHGKGSFVRSAGQPSLTLERRIKHATGGQFAMPGGDVWKEVETPSTYRARTTETTGRLLKLGEEEALFGCDRLLIDPTSGTRATHRTLIPFEVAESVPPLAEDPGSTRKRCTGCSSRPGTSCGGRRRYGPTCPCPTSAPRSSSPTRPRSCTCPASRTAPTTAL